MTDWGLAPTEGNTGDTGAVVVKSEGGRVKVVQEGHEENRNSASERARPGVKANSSGKGGRITPKPGVIGKGPKKGKQGGSGESGEITPKPGVMGRPQPSPGFPARRSRRRKDEEEEYYQAPTTLTITMR